jgi:hypothetical protein
MHDRDLFFAVLGVIVFLGYLVFGGVPIYERLMAGINAIHVIMQTANHAGEDRAGRVR